ncbi:hypothetical protein [Nesterenkonia rhizosphaerae]|uniref:Uncharacterized protein n=1 Tax=Nesterenkonia rhizosphaerae TaxID=1348272 RepID=A0ABP9G073_9MICC
MSTEQAQATANQAEAPAEETRQEYQDQAWYSTEGWAQVPCALSDALHRHGQPEEHPGALRIFSTITDPDGMHGSAVIYTEWGVRVNGVDTPLLREYRWPQEPERDCEHWVNTTQNIAEHLVAADD